MRFNRNPYVWVSPATITPRELFPKPDKPNAVFLDVFLTVHHELTIY